MSPLDRYRIFGSYNTKWRKVDLRTTMDIAHRCSSGVNFTGSPKSQIIDGIAKPNGYSSNPAKFKFLMDAATRFIPPLKTEFDRNVFTNLERLEGEFKANQKS